MGGAFGRNARTDAVEGQQTAYVNLWDSFAQAELQIEYKEHITRGSRAADLATRAS